MPQWHNSYYQIIPMQHEKTLHQGNDSITRGCGYLSKQGYLGEKSYISFYLHKDKDVVSLSQFMIEINARERD